MVKFNLIGFNRYCYSKKEFGHCGNHPAARFIALDTDPDLLFCPRCGTRYPLKVTVFPQDIQSSIPPTTDSCTKIISAKSKPRQVGKHLYGMNGQQDTR